MVTTVRKHLETPFGPRDAGLPMDLDEFEAADFEEGYRYEVIHGILVVTPSPLEEERSMNEELGHWLRNYREDHPDGTALDDTLHEHTIRTKKSQRRCDRAVWAGFGKVPRTRGPVAKRDIPTIIVEFPSGRPADQRRDYVEKKAEYRELRVREYWIIDRFRRQMTVHSRVDSKWTSRTFAESDVYRTDLLPGFELPIGKLLGFADRYSDQPLEE